MSDYFVKQINLMLPKFPEKEHVNYRLTCMYLYKNKFFPVCNSCI